MSDFINKIRNWSYNKQNLGKQGNNIETVLQDIIGVYSAHPSAPLSLYARLQSFTPQDFYNLDTQKQALRVPAMRESVYMLPKENAFKIMSATIPVPSDAYWQKRYSVKGRIIPPGKYPEWKEQIFKILTEPKSVSDIKNEIEIPDESVKPVINRMAFEGLVLRFGAKSLRSNIISYVSTPSWLNKQFEETNNETALSWLAAKYLKAFGPARIKDFQWWAGTTVTKAKAAIAALETINIENDYHLLSIELENFEKSKIDLHDSLDILPQWDCYIMGYAPEGRERFVSPDMQHHIYGKIGATGGNSFGTILINGLAHGLWTSKFKADKMIISLSIFEKLSSKMNEIMKKQFSEIAALLDAKDLIFENHQ